jgi:uncharacterized protein (TIGR02594 family)
MKLQKTTQLFLLCSVALSVGGVANARELKRDAVIGKPRPDVADSSARKRRSTAQAWHHQARHAGKHQRVRHARVPAAEWAPTFDRHTSRDWAEVRTDFHGPGYVDEPRWPVREQRVRHERPRHARMQPVETVPEFDRHTSRDWAVFPAGYGPQAVVEAPRAARPARQRPVRARPVQSVALNDRHAANDNGAGSNIVAEARRYLGGNPTGMSRLWCAAFMNMVLERSGLKGTGSNLAKSFASYGTRVAGPQVGAIAVMTRGKNGGHVGVVSGIDSSGNPIIISGNHNRRVAEAVYPRQRIYAYVMP